MALRANSSAGFSTGSKLIIFAVIVFSLLGYSVFLSICLGVIAGVTGGFIASWWNAKEDFITDEPSTVAATVVEEGVKPGFPLRARSRPPRYGIGVRLARRSRTTGAVRRFGWPLFRRRRRRR
ncbi:MAG: hypothetical protein HC866_09735 [Leptolyngbyaceae cyanobacterium RU_5_1]|nr:hypothetical protein [Leptolyngbyaceae cyanobacterium RU_5_1]